MYTHLDIFNVQPDVIGIEVSKQDKTRRSS